MVEILLPLFLCVLCDLGVFARDSSNVFDAVLAHTFSWHYAGLLFFLSFVKNVHKDIMGIHTDINTNCTFAVPFTE